VTAYRSAPEDLVLHGPRILGFVTPSQVAARFGLDPDLVEELLLDHQARGWVAYSEFAGSAGWHVTDAGRREGERRLADELDRTGSRETAVRAHADFLPLNVRFGRACTDWQVRPIGSDRMSANDHTDWRWDARVLDTLARLEKGFAAVAGELAARLLRFDGYADRYAAARARVEAGHRRWLDGIEVDSCHTVWIQFHEDLLATLGVPRGSDT
jgi:hypothetical protein